MSSERIRELEDKIHQLRMERLLQLDYITEEAKKATKVYDELDKELQSVLQQLAQSESKGAYKYSVIVSAIRARMNALNGMKNLWQQMRLVLRELRKEEDSLMLRKMDMEE